MKNRKREENGITYRIMKLIMNYLKNFVSKFYWKQEEYDPIVSLILMFFNLLNTFK